MEPSYATIDKVTVRSDSSGVDLEVTLHPVGQKTNVRLGFAYEGAGFGLFVLPEVGDEVVCVFPGGDINSGVAIARMPNKLDSIPSGVGHDKILLVGKDGHDLDVTINGDVTMNVTGSADVIAEGAATLKSSSGAVKTEGATIGTVKAPSVVLGAGGGSEKTLATSDLIAWLEDHIHQGVTPGAGNSGTPTAAPGVSCLTTATKAD